LRFALAILSAGDTRPELAPNSVGVAVCARDVPGRDVGARIVEDDVDAWCRSPAVRGRGAGGGIIVAAGRCEVGKARVYARVSQMGWVQDPGHNRRKQCQEALLQARGPRDGGCG
jgi:hypothetical protein